MDPLDGREVFIVRGDERTASKPLSANPLAGGRVITQ